MLQGRASQRFLKVFSARTAPYITFTAAGVGFALPGALLPILFSQWSWKDEQIGFLLFLFSSGTTLGALLTKGSLRASVFRGYVFTASGAALLNLPARPAALVAMTAYGFGLGTLITAVSLLQAQRHPDDRAAELSRLNLLWALGACAGPWLVLRRGAGNASYTHHVLLAVAAVCVALSALTALTETKPLPQSYRQPDPDRPLNALPFALLVMVFCATGVESSAGGWLAAYAQRTTHSLRATIGAPTCFWVGLLLSRALLSFQIVSRRAQRWLFTWNLILMTAALAGIIASHREWPALLCALLAGFTSGPMYPALLARVLALGGGSAVFALAGVGASTLPLLTGAAATWSGSLRFGLLVPAMAAVVMAAAGWKRWKPT